MWKIEERNGDIFLVLNICENCDEFIKHFYDWKFSNNFDYENIPPVYIDDMITELEVGAGLRNRILLNAKNIKEMEKSLSEFYKKM